MTGKNDWRYKYFGTKYEKRLFKNLNYCLEHIDEFVEVDNSIKETGNFLNLFNLSEKDKEVIFKYFGVTDDRVYKLGEYKLIVFGSCWMLSFDDGDSHVSKYNRDKYITNIVEDKLREKGFIE